MKLIVGSNELLGLMNIYIYIYINTKFAQSCARPKKGLKQMFEAVYDQNLTYLSFYSIHDVMHKRAPKPIRDLLSLDRESSDRNLRSHHSDPHHFRTPFAKYRTSTNSFCFKGPQLWNNLPKEIKDIDSKNSFKNRLKAKLLDSYNEKIDCNNPNCSDKKHHHWLIHVFLYVLVL